MSVFVFGTRADDLDLALEHHEEVVRRGRPLGTAGHRRATGTLDAELPELVELRRTERRPRRVGEAGGREADESSSDAIARSSAVPTTPWRIGSRRAARIPYLEPAVVGEAELGPRADGHRLAVAVADATAGRVGDADRGVAELVQAARDVGRPAVGDAFALDVQRAAELAVVMAVESEVEPGTEVDARCRRARRS